MSGLQIVTKSFSSGGQNVATLGHRVIDLPYIPVYTAGYGRMDKSTPASGLATSGAASCICVVLHCSDSGRTVLTHSPRQQCQETSFTPIIEWLVAGTNVQQPDVQVVVLRGFTHAVPKLAAVFGHSEWMVKFREFMDNMPCNVNIVDETRLLMAGAVLVDKDTAKITIVDGITPVFVKNDSISRDYYFQSSLDFLMVTYRMLLPPYLASDLRLQFDVTEYMRPVSLDDGARLVLRSKFNGEPETKQDAILRAAGVVICHDSLEMRTFMMRSDEVVAIGMPCERCHLKGIKRCQRCLGAWYCGSGHQKDDWKSHRTWCDSNKMEYRVDAPEHLNTGLEIVVKSFDNVIRDGALGSKVLELPYMHIYADGYGRMDKTTPSCGLATSFVGDCICVVLHCKQTSRTVLTHALRWQSLGHFFKPMIDWLLMDIKTSAPIVEVVVLRGFHHDTNRAVSYSLLSDHLNWLNHFRSYMATMPCTVNIVNEKRLLMAGSVLVDKVTAKITIVDGNAVIQILNNLTPSYICQAAMDSLVTAFNAIKPPHGPLALHLQYDVTKYQTPRPLPLIARQFLRSRSMGEDGALNVKQMQILKSVGFEHVSSAVDEEFRSAYQAVLWAGISCELCYLKGIKRCSRCLGAWYCGKEHQTKGWKSHKSVCKELELYS